MDEARVVINLKEGIILKNFPHGGSSIKMANEIGKRYRCPKCGSEFIVTRGGEGTIRCCGQPMELKK